MKSAPAAATCRWLPMAFNPLDDRFDWYTRFMFVQHLASLVPLYGRSRHGHAWAAFFSRGGEPLCFAPTRRPARSPGQRSSAGPRANRRRQVRHAGQTDVRSDGHRPTATFVIEAGNFNFGLLADDFARHGITVNRLSIKPDGLRQASGGRLSLNPFSRPGSCSSRTICF